MDATMKYTYKTLTSTDASLFKTLLRVFGEAFEELDTYQSAVPGEAYLRDLLGQQHFIALVALDGDTVVGGLVAYELQKFEQARKELYIYDLAVSAEHRRKGIATNLIRELQRVDRHRQIRG
jgi:aminoglycoside 3-N-acetyltransferase I